MYTVPLIKALHPHSSKCVHKNQLKLWRKKPPFVNTTAVTTSQIFPAVPGRKKFPNFSKSKYRKQTKPIHTISTRHP